MVVVKVPTWSVTASVTGLIPLLAGRRALLYRRAVLSRRPAGRGNPASGAASSDRKSKANRSPLPSEAILVRDRGELGGGLGLTAWRKAKHFRRGGVGSVKDGRQKGVRKDACRRRRAMARAGEAGAAHP